MLITAATCLLLAPNECLNLNSSNKRLRDFFSLLEAVMNEPVGLQQDDDVTVLNRPAAQALYQPRHSTAQDTMDDEI